MTKLIDYVKLAAISYKGKADPARLPDGWKPLHTAADHGLARAGYSGMTFMNAATKEVVIASSGTSFNFKDPIDLIQDLSSCWSLFSGKVPAQYSEAALPYAQLTLSQLAPDITVKFVGHSLGASLTEMLTAYAIRENHNATGIAIDGPGTLPQITNLFPELADTKSLPITHYVSQHDTGVVWNQRSGTRIELPMDYEPGLLANIGFQTLDKFWQLHFLGTWMKAPATHATLVDDALIEMIADTLAPAFFLDTESND